MPEMAEVDRPRPATKQNTRQADNPIIVAAITAIMREASAASAHAGGSRHFVRDYFLPILNAHGWVVDAIDLPAMLTPATAVVPRLRGRELQRRRAALFARTPLCELCAAAGRQTKATIRGHRVPLERGGTEAIANEQAECLACADHKHAAQVALGVPVAPMTPGFRRRAAPRTPRGHFTRRQMS